MFGILEKWLIYPAPRTNRADWDVMDLPFEDVYFHAKDGTRLHGWLVSHPQPKALVLYCHGNGEYVPRLATRLKVFHHQIGATVFAWDYRGYGLSHGQPHEENLISDAREAQLRLADRAGACPDDVVVMGCSLGGAVAVALAAQFPVRALVLDRTFATLLETAAYHFPWLPVRRFLSNRFDSLGRIQHYHGPLLQIHGSADQIVPIAMGRQLFDAAPSKQKRFIEIPDGGHNGPPPDYCYEQLDAFLDELPPLEA